MIIHRTSFKKNSFPKMNKRQFQQKYSCNIGMKLSDALLILLQSIIFDRTDTVKMKSIEKYMKQDTVKKRNLMKTI
jgi:hypothetical protein